MEFLLTEREGGGEEGKVKRMKRFYAVAEEEQGTARGPEKSKKRPSRAES